MHFLLLSSRWKRQVKLGLNAAQAIKRYGKFGKKRVVIGALASEN